MKALVQLAASAAATAILLGGAASQATPLAELPLKAAVLAKPNVVFGMDDSGSMDWEIVLGTDNGYAWWNGSGSAWDAVNNRPLEMSGASDGMSYLFPMGTGTGGQIYAIGSAYGRVAPPIAQLAWLRSSAFNPIYYNTMATYPAWSPAYVGGALRAYANAVTTAAPSHPGPLAVAPSALNVGADWDAANASFANSTYFFSVMPGMALPVGTRVVASTTASGVCSGATTRVLSAVTTVAAGSRCQASIPYFPATFWQRTVCPNGDAKCVAAPDCVAEDPAVNPNASCVAAPDGLGKLRRYEIRAGNTFPSGRSYVAELQNFANWFTYYRKRKLMLAGAMGRVLEPITGLRLGVVAFNNRVAVTMVDADATAASGNHYSVAGNFYLNAMSSNGTPTHAIVKHIGSQFNDNTSIVQYACQRNNLFVVTDGFSNTATIAPPAWDAGKSAATWGAAAPYQTTIDGSLADLGLRYYTNRLRAAGASPLPAGKVPAGDPTRPNPILNTDLHVVTYGITLGARGKLFPAAPNPFAVDIFATPPNWPVPVGDDPSMIDDLWHATLNGRGRMFLANDVDAMRLSIQTAFDDILSQQGAQGGVAVSSVNLDRGDSQAYLGSYNPSGWTGNLTANPISAATGTVDFSRFNWSAADLLAARDWTTRVIVTSSGGAGVDFTAAATGLSAGIVDYLRGQRAGEGDVYRTRKSLIGAVINAEPVLAREEKMVYLASGEGMLHAFDTITGKEEWAYVPPDVGLAMADSSQRGWVFRTLLDATPAYGRLSSGQKWLVGGLGAAGRSYYALDVSSPRNLTAAQAAGQFKWRFTHANMGYTVGKPVLVRTGANADRILVTSGYDNGTAIGDGRGRLWVLNPDGSVDKSFKTETSTGAGGGAVHPGQENGLAFVSAFRQPDGTVRYAYGGDLLGNLWRFDLTKNGLDIPAERVAVLRDAAGNLQPVTAAPELMTVAGKRVILIGTGRLLDIGDFGKTTPTQSFYAIADADTELDLANARASLVQQTFNRGANPQLTNNAVDFATQTGWFFDLPGGEQATTDPIVTYGAVAFVTNKNGGSDCTQESYLYLVDVVTGTKVKDSAFVSETIATNATSSRVITLRVVDGKIIGTTHKSDNKVFQKQLPLGTTIPPSKNAWHEIRR